MSVLMMRRLVRQALVLLESDREAEAMVVVRRLFVPRWT
jgi:hypothetical protein